MNTCDTCKHWKFPYVPGEFEYWLKGCPDKKSQERYMNGDGSLIEVTWGVCGSGKISLNECPEKDQCGIGAREEDRHGQVVCGPKFGCIHHEIKT